MIKKMLLVMALMVAGLFAAPTPAQAAWSDCANYPGTVCMAQHGDWAGSIWRQTAEQIPGCRSVVPDGFNDKASAVMNRLSGHYQVRFWQHANCTGNYLTVPSEDYRILNGNLAELNDEISAVQVIAL